MTHRIEHIGDCELHLADCREVLPTLGRVDAVVTDPPYGIGFADNAKHVGGGWRVRDDNPWDAQRPDKTVFDLIQGCSSEQIIWGGNYFTDYVPPSMRWLIWDKGQRDFSLADVEMAWTSQQSAARAITFARGKAVKDGKEHPTQKPLEVMKWCIGFVTKKTGAILDPFMGSGTTGVACVKLGRKFIGIEIDSKYFDIACRRIEEAYKQPDMFVSAPEQPKAEQMDLLA